MDKLKLQTPNKADENFKKLSALFPNAVTETINENGELVRAIDKDILMQEINTSVVEGKEERYQFTWPDKKKSILLANSPISKTLRPCREESVDFDNTENLYIEGDNLEVLKLLQETYLGKIKMIYIDPPYNTGNDFVYNDDFSESSEEYLDRSGQFDDEGNRLVQNTESNGRFHTDWLNMIYPRLKLAKDLLSDDGAIFISIDDNEIENILKICNEIFGEINQVASILREAIKGGSISKNIRKVHDFVICYAKNIDAISFGGVEANGIELNLEDEHGKYAKGRELNKWGAGSRREDSPSMFFPIPGPNGEDVYPIRNDGSEGRWRLGKNKMIELLNAGNAIFEQRKDGSYIVYEKIRNNMPKIKQFTTWFANEYINAKGTEELKKLFNKERTIFDFSKPTQLIKDILLLNNEENCIVLDFFSGSSTTAHAVMQLNAEDGGNRKFIMVQLPEKTDEKSEGYKAGYKNICEIGKERIRRAGKKIVEDLEKKRYSKLGAKDPFDETKELWSKGQVSFPGVFREDFGYTDDDGKTQKIEYHSPQNPKDKYFYNPETLDIGFRVLKCDTTNMKDVYYSPAEFTVQTLDGMEDNIKEDRTEEDLLFQVMLDLGVLLSSRIEEKIIDGKRVFVVGDENYLVACFDENITEETVTEIAKMKPYYFVIRDSSMASDSVAANFEQIFEAYSPTTVRKVL